MQYLDSQKNSENYNLCNSSPNALAVYSSYSISVWTFPCRIGQNKRKVVRKKIFKKVFFMCVQELYFVLSEQVCRTKLNTLLTRNENWITETKKAIKKLGVSENILNLLYLSQNRWYKVKQTAKPNNIFTSKKVLLGFFLPSKVKIVQHFK